MIPSNKIMVAIDTRDSLKVLTIFDALSGKDIWVKIGMEAFFSSGPVVVYEAKARGFKVFLDLKLHDIPNTVAQGLMAISHLPIDMVNIHAAGGSEMMTKGVEALKTLDHPPKLIAVTQLTSTSQEQMNLEQKIDGALLDSVINYSLLSKKCGLQGVVCSPLEVRAIKEACGKDFLTITPGIRPKNSDTHDQKRVTTPAEAMKLGTDFMVIGRPITASSDPRAALEAILKGE